MKLSKEEVEEWVEPLESGDYQRDSGTLQSAQGYCCLGVLFDLLVQDETPGLGWQGNKTRQEGVGPSFVDPYINLKSLVGGHRIMRGLTSKNDRLPEDSDFTEVVTLVKQTVPVDEVLPSAS